MNLKELKALIDTMVDQGHGDREVCLLGPEDYEPVPIANIQATDTRVIFENSNPDGAESGQEESDEGSED